MDKLPIKLPNSHTVPFRKYEVTAENSDRKEMIGKLLYFVLVFGLGFWIGVSITLWITLVILGVR